MSDDWNHRSQFLDSTDPGLKYVSRNVNERRDGPSMRFRHNPEWEPRRTEQERDEEAAKGERRLHTHYHPRHIPDSYEPPETDTRSNRERLLDGETV